MLLLLRSRLLPAILIIGMKSVGCSEWSVARALVHHFLIQVPSADNQDRIFIKSSQDRRLDRPTRK